MCHLSVDIAFYAEAIERNPKVICYGGYDDRRMVLAKLRAKPTLFKKLPKQLQRDLEVIRETIKHNVHMLEFVDMDKILDEGVLFEAYKQVKNVLQLAPYLPSGYIKQNWALFVGFELKKNNNIPSAIRPDCARRWCDICILTM
jgi:hypothetical protein